MAHHKFEYDAKCTSCKGTGLYVGIAERDGSAVVCHSCKGAGRVHKVIEWDDPEEKAIRDNVSRVYEVNPGIVIGTGNGFKLTDFGGMPYEDWLKGMPFPANSENRKFTCPCWWYQSADYTKKPNWEWCMESLGSSFSRCKHFCDKEKCWERWDKEYGSAAQEAHP